MQPNFGTGLQALLFEQMDAEFESKLEETITKNVNYWLPYINIQQIDIEMTDEMKDRNIANMSIQFTVGNQINTEEITFTIRG
jgi:phage baseplate assembly protein W